MATRLNINTKDPRYQFQQTLDSIMPALQQAVQCADVTKLDEARQVVGKLTAARMICERVLNPNMPAGQIAFKNPKTGDVPALEGRSDE